MLAARVLPQAPRLRGSALGAGGAEALFRALSSPGSAVALLDVSSYGIVCEGGPGLLHALAGASYGIVCEGGPGLLHALAGAAASYGIVCEGAPGLLHALAGAAALAHLDVSDNVLGDAGGAGIAALLRFCASLVDVAARGCFIDGSCVPELRAALAARARPGGHRVRVDISVGVDGAPMVIESLRGVAGGDGLV